MAVKKIRLDRYLAEHEISVSIDKAKSEILCGWIKVNGETVRDTSYNVSPDDDVTAQRPGGKFVSRGGEKIEKALHEFSIDVSGCVCADLGASTGGFTDCLLKNGAAKVYAVDVGYGQLDYSLRSDSRVVVMEKTNARNICAQMFDEKVLFVCADLSFVSFTKIYPVIASVFPDASGVALIKPQFEAEEYELVKGIVREEAHHVEIVNRTLAVLRKSGCSVKGLSYSPIKGPKGNIEFLLFFGCGADDNGDINVEACVRCAHEELS